MKKNIVYLFLIFGFSFLFVTNTKAFTIYSDDNYIVDEQFIYNTFVEIYPDFTFNKFPYVYCGYREQSSTRRVGCYAMTEELFNNLYVKSHYSSYGYYDLNNYEVTTSKVGFDLRIYNNTRQDTLKIDEVFPNWTSSTVTLSLYYSNTYEKSYTNFNPSLISGISSDYDTKINKLDFSRYEVQLKFDENLFKDNSNFKEICIDKGKKYGITTTNIDTISNTAFVSDFIWFPGKTTGVKYSEYDSLNDNNILIFNDDVSKENYYFKDKDKIDAIYNDEIVSNYFNHSGYTDKYSYYGYTAYKFIHSYYVDENNKQQNMFTIFDFTDINYSPFGSAGGSSSSFGDTPLTYCFYIKNEFNVTELKTNEWNDYMGVVPTPGGNLEVNTSYNKNNANTEGFLSQPIKFISEMSGTITFLNANIYNLYMSMPLVVRTFLITALIILIVMLIMKIGGYK